jgi:hypothetical protein
MKSIIAYLNMDFAEREDLVGGRMRLASPWEIVIFGDEGCCQSAE